MVEADRMTRVAKIFMRCDVCQTTLASAPVRLQLQTEAKTGWHTTGKTSPGLTHLSEVTCRWRGQNVRKPDQWIHHLCFGYTILII